MNLEERVKAIEALGFTHSQARFITMVALHGGYCLRRQYLQFSGLRYGKNVRDFLDGLVERRLAQRRLFLPNRGYIYHLHAKALYRLLEQPENRNRRVASAALIARKVMLLDVVLARPEADWYATEDDKVRLFTERFNLQTEILPRRVFTSGRVVTRSTTRYFIDKLPICVALEPPCVFFIYLPVDSTTAGFRHFLIDHAELLARLRTWRVVLPSSPMMGKVESYFSVFDQFRRGTLLAPATPSISDLNWYFRAKTLVERGDLRTLSVADITRFRRLRDQLTAPRYQDLYNDWLSMGDAAFQSLQPEPQPPERFAGGLVVYELSSRYRQFGSLPGVA